MKSIRFAESAYGDLDIFYVTSAQYVIIIGRLVDGRPYNAIMYTYINFQYIVYVALPFMPI